MNDRFICTRKKLGTNLHSMKQELLTTGAVSATYNSNVLYKAKCPPLARFDLAYPPRSPH